VERSGAVKMVAIVFDGYQLAQEKEMALKKKVARQRRPAKGGPPKLVIVLVGNNPSSNLYVEKKKQAGERIGIKVEIKKFRISASEKEVIKFIKAKNVDKHVQGIIVQLPLPKNFAELKIRSSINPLKDVDCLHPQNLGLVLAGKARFYPAAVKAVLEILASIATPTRSAFAHLGGVTGKEVVIVGASNLVGKPLAMALSNLGATVTICRSTTRDLIFHTKRAEILISATGKTGLIQKEMVKKGAIVIDVGEIKGDVDHNTAQVSSFVSLVPGGVGPMTVVSLLENVLSLC